MKDNCDFVGLSFIFIYTVYLFILQTDRVCRGGTYR